MTTSFSCWWILFLFFFPFSWVQGNNEVSTVSCDGHIAQPCQGWSTRFGNKTTHKLRLVVECDECVVMDYEDSFLFLSNGLDIRGRMVVPDHHRIRIFTALLLVQGELEMVATKPVDGVPLIDIIMIGDTDQPFVPMQPHFCSLMCNAGKKSITVAGGKVNLRGLPHDTPTWVKLYDVTEDLGTIIVDKSVRDKWAPGAGIFLTSHTRKPDDHQLRTIVRVYDLDENYVALVLHAPIELPATHKYNGLHAVEVGLLSRNIRFDSVYSSDPADGGHFWVFRTPNVRQHIEGVEIRRFGQQGQLGRYPIHFHYCDSVKGSVVRGNSIWQSNQRCIVVHGTNGVLVEDNVAFDTKGHCYMLEDGIETGNRFLNNLGAYTRKPETIIPDMGKNGKETDDNPATFWITNTMNEWNGNVAAGSYGSGFWFELLLRGARMDEFQHLKPKELLLSHFSNNLAHSNTWGLRTYPSGYEPAELALLDTFTALRNNMGISLHRTRNLTIRRGLFADNRISIDVDVSDDIQIDESIFLGLSPYLNALTHSKKLEKHLCNGPHVGVEVHTHREDRRNRGLSIRKSSFLGFSDIPCDSAVALRMDDTNKTGVFDFFTTIEDCYFEPGGRFVDMCESVDDVYLIDFNGNSAAHRKLRKRDNAASVVQKNEKMLKFVDQSKCVDAPDRCYTYCEETCFRTIQFTVDPSAAKDLFLRVCAGHSNTPDDQCLLVSGKREANVSSNFMVFLFHLPRGEYTIGFVDAETQRLVWPSFAKMDPGEKLCNDAVSENDIQVHVPEPDNCAELVRPSTTSWFQRGDMALSTDASDLRVGADTTLYQYLDSRCLKQMAGSFYEINVEFNIQGRDGSVRLCNSATEKCPEVGLYDHASGTFRVVARAKSDSPIHGYVKLTSDYSLENPSSLMIRSNIPEAVLIVHSVRMSLVSMNCEENLIDDMDEQSWTPNPSGGPGRFLWTTSGSLQYTERDHYLQGPAYNLRSIDVECFVPKSRWRVEGSLRFADNKTCDGVRSCPLVRLVVLDADFERLHLEKLQLDQSSMSSFGMEATLPDFAPQVAAVVRVDVYNFDVGLDVVIERLELVLLD